MECQGKKTRTVSFWSSLPGLARMRCGSHSEKLDTVRWSGRKKGEGLGMAEDTIQAGL